MRCDSPDFSGGKIHKHSTWGGKVLLSLESCIVCATFASRRELGKVEPSFIPSSKMLGRVEPGSILSSKMLGRVEPGSILSRKKY